MKDSLCEHRMPECMRFDIVPLRDAYAGIDRSLTPDDFLTGTTKPYYDALLSVYFEYLDWLCSPDSRLQYDRNDFCRMAEFYKKFRDYRVSCEVIAFGDEPIRHFFDGTFDLKLLGIDIVHDMAESLIHDPSSLPVCARDYLNPNGLCYEIGDVRMIMEHVRCGDHAWKPCWVYKVLL